MMYQKKYGLYLHCLITIDSVMRMDKKNHPQVHLKDCKYRVKKIQMSKFTNAEVESDSDSNSDSNLDMTPVH